MRKSWIVLTIVLVGTLVLIGLSMRTAEQIDPDRDVSGPIRGLSSALVAPLVLQLSDGSNASPTVEQSIGALTAAVTRALDQSKSGDELTALRSLVLQLSKSLLDERTVSNRLIELQTYQLNDRLRTDSFNSAIEQSHIEWLRKAVALLRSDAEKVNYPKQRTAEWIKRGEDAITALHKAMAQTSTARKSSVASDSTVATASTLLAQSLSGSPKIVDLSGERWVPLPKSDLLLGLCDLTPPELYRFMASLRRTGSLATIVCFHTKLMSADELMDMFGVYRDFGPVVFEFVVVPSGISPLNYRFTAYQHWLSAHRSEYDRVLMVDVRDLIFQTDPFLYIPRQSSNGGKGGLLLTLESEVTSLESCATNRKWIIDCYGNTVFTQIQKNRVLCSGVLGGSIDAIDTFLNVMAHEIDTKRPKPDTPPSVAPICTDQAILNVLTWQKRWNSPESALNVVLVDVEDGPYLHTHAKLCDQLKTIGSRDFYGRYMNVHRTSVASIVHQYDRCKYMEEHIAALYPTAEQPLSAEESALDCAGMKTRFGIQPGLTLGRLPTRMYARYYKMNCENAAVEQWGTLPSSAASNSASSQPTVFNALLSPLPRNSPWKLIRNVFGGLAVLIAVFCCGMYCHVRYQATVQMYASREMQRLEREVNDEIAAETAASAAATAAADADDL